eukprot:326788-Pyramimonas_sp.AAC.1
MGGSQSERRPQRHDMQGNGVRVHQVRGLGAAEEEPQVARAVHLANDQGPRSAQQPEKGHRAAQEAGQAH